MHKDDTYQMMNKSIIITIPIDTDADLEKFILDNAYMYNKIRNDFAEEANKYKGTNNKYTGFKPGDFKTKYLNEVEMPENRYDYYCVGLSEQVATNFIKSTKSIRTKNEQILSGKRKGTLGEYHFKRFDYNRYTFRVKLKPGYVSGLFYTRLYVKDRYNIEFSVRGSFSRKIKLPIRLKEALCDKILIDDDIPVFKKYYESNGMINECNFTLNDIKDICFKYEVGKYYIQLFTDVTYLINSKSRMYPNGRVAGIDSGIRHPLTLCDGTKSYYIRMDDKTIRKIHYIERRIGRLDKVRQHKYDYNKEHNISTHSKNIIKVVKKIRRLYRKITNIKNHWVRNICKQIATSYDCIVVDTFTQPDHKDKESQALPKKVLRRINYANRFHKSYYLDEFLRHDCDKYGCEYIESPPNTTCTCSYCGYVNVHLKLSEHNLVCSNCNNVIERDLNAAKNCYMYALRA